MHRTLVDILRARAQTHPDRAAFTYLPNGEAPERTVTLGELDAQARAIAAALEEQGLGGQRVLLLHLPDLQFVTAFFGCLYAGSAAVPLALLDLRRVAKALPTLLSIVSDCAPAGALTSSSIADVVDQALLRHSALKGLKVLCTDALEHAPPAAWRSPALAPDTVAFLQYTSGSTGTPKGVINAHRNLLANLAVIESSLGVTPDDRAVSWLPFFHDMGLIGHVLQPVYSGCHSILMPPTAFIAKPIRWLNAISRYRATISGGPSFAYDLCLKKVTPEQLQGVALDSWRVAFTGAEAIRAGMLDEFDRAFSPAGFDSAAFFPCYGMAEATLFVSGAHCRTPRYQSLAQLRSADLDESEPIDSTHARVDCGRPAPAHEVVVVDPEARAPVPPCCEGEIWFSGPSVAQGYWNRPEETAHQFHAHLAGGSKGPYLRTGDLGFLRQGRLYVTGRNKDLIIVRGQNHYPSDIEQTAEAAHPNLRPRACAAFSVEQSGEERLCLLCETGRLEAARAHELVEAIRGAVQRAHDLLVQAIALVPHGTLARTSSGKLRRRACRELFLSALPNSTYLWTNASPAPGPGSRPVVAFAEGEMTARNVEDVFEEVKKLLADFIPKGHAVPIGLDMSPVRDLSLDSIAIAELLGRINSHFSIQVDYRKLFFEKPDPDAFTIRDVCALITECHRSSGAGLSTALR